MNRCQRLKTCNQTCHSSVQVHAALLARHGRHGIAKSACWKRHAWHGMAARQGGHGTGPEAGTPDTIILSRKNRSGTARHDWARGIPAKGECHPPRVILITKPSLVHYLTSPLWFISKGAMLALCVNTRLLLVSERVTYLVLPGSWVSSEQTSNSITLF